MKKILICTIMLLMFALCSCSNTEEQEKAPQDLVTEDVAERDEIKEDGISPSEITPKPESEETYTEVIEENLNKFEVYIVYKGINLSLLSSFESIQSEIPELSMNDGEKIVRPKSNETIYSNGIYLDAAENPIFFVNVKRPEEKKPYSQCQIESFSQKNQSYLKEDEKIVFTGDLSVGNSLNDKIFEILGEPYSKSSFEVEEKGYVIYIFKSKEAFYQITVDSDGIIDMIKMTSIFVEGQH